MTSSKDGQWEGDDDDSQNSYEPSDRDNTPAPRAPTSRASTYHLRDASQIKRPGRYRVDDPVGPLTHPTYIHPRPPFNKDLAKLIPWNTVPLDHPGPLSSDMAYERLLAERERKKNDPNAEDEVSFRPFQHVLNGESSGPYVAHLSRKAPPKDPLGYLYTPDESIYDNTKFHPPSDKWSYRDEYNPEFSLDDFDEEQNESQRELEQRKAAYVNWSSLSDGVKWAIIHDLSTSYGFTSATQQLSLSVDEILNFKRLYRREQEKWDAYESSITCEAQEALERAPNECARPFARPDPNAPPAPALELVTDSISRDEINEGRRFLKFMGLNKYVAGLDKWYGSGSGFHEIPHVLDVDLDFFEEPRYRYPGPPAVDETRQSNLPQSVGNDPEARPTDFDNDNAEGPFMVCPPSPGMPDPALHGRLRPLVIKNYNPDAMDLARQAFRVPFASKRTSASREAPLLQEGSTPSLSKINHNWSNMEPFEMDMIMYDPVESVRVETERIRGNLKPTDLPVGAQKCAGYRYATQNDLLPRSETVVRSQHAANANTIMPSVEKAAVPLNRKSPPAQVLSEATKEGCTNDFALDGPSRNRSADEQGDRHTTRDAGDFASNTPPLPAAGVIPRGEVLQRVAGNPPQHHAAGATPLQKTGHGGLAGGFKKPYVRPNHYEDSDVSDPELDEFPPEKDDPNDGDYRQRKSGQRKKSAGQKRTAGMAQLGSDATAARSSKKPCTSRTKSEPSGSNKKRIKNLPPATTTSGKGTSTITPFESTSATAPKNKAQRSHSASTLPRSDTGVPQQSVPGSVPPNMQQKLDICSDRQLFEMGLLDQSSHQAAVHAEHSSHSASRPTSKGSILPKTYGEYISQTDAKAVTQTPSHPSTTEPDKGT